MKIANVAGRAAIVTGGGVVDIATASNGTFSHDISKILPVVNEVERWFASVDIIDTEVISQSELQYDHRLGVISPNPSQIFAIGLNYRQHAEEMQLQAPTQPMVFTKFQSSLAQPNSKLAISTTTTDYETELVVVFGKSGRNIPSTQAWEYVAGLSVGQDFSERTMQSQGNPAQFSLAKSWQGFAPIGPWLATISEFPDVSDITIGCSINDEVMQHCSTQDMIFNIPDLISYLSKYVEIRAGDLMFTGSPHGVGQGRNPQRFLRPGDVIKTYLVGGGSFKTACIEAVTPPK